MTMERRETMTFLGKDMSQETLDSILDFYKDSNDLRKEMILKKAQNSGTRLIPEFDDLLPKDRDLNLMIGLKKR